MNLFLSFLIYSFLGWVCETIYCSIGSRKFVNRGFLNGPICPIYGFGALSVVWFLRPVQGNIILLFLLGMLVASLLEYVTGYLLEVLFHTKWWDYSSYKFQIRGRVCLQNSLMFGGLSVVAMRLINPTIDAMIAALPLWIRAVATCFFGVYLLSDATITVHTILEMNGKLKELELLIEEAKERTRKAREELGESLRAEALEKNEEILQKLNSKIASLAIKNKFLRHRLLEAFPGMRSDKYEISLERIKEEILKLKK